MKRSDHISGNVGRPNLQDSWEPGAHLTQEAEIRRISVRSQPKQIVHETLSQKNPSQKSTGGVAQV
jgi:hypothetical protein